MNFITVSTTAQAAVLNQIATNRQDLAEELVKIACGIGAALDVMEDGGLPTPPSTEKAAGYAAACKALFPVAKAADVSDEDLAAAMSGKPVFFQVG